MITFLPFEDFNETAKSLDSKRLGKQRIETLQLLNSIYFQTLKGNIFLAKRVLSNLSLLLNDKYAYANHPAKLMWDDYPHMLVAYGLEICIEWKNRGYQDTTYDKIEAYSELFLPDIYTDQNWLKQNKPDLVPPWLGDNRLHTSHRSQLIQKSPEHYKLALGWNDPDNLEYYWPITKNEN